MPIRNYPVCKLCSKVTGVILVAAPIINLSRMDVTHPNYGLTNSIEEALAPDIGISPLPRAVLRPNSYVLLDGEWSFALDLEDRGILETWYITHHYCLLYTSDAADERS